MPIPQTTNICDSTEDATVGSCVTINEGPSAFRSYTSNDDSKCGVNASDIATTCEDKGTTRSRSGSFSNDSVSDDPVTPSDSMEKKVNGEYENGEEEEAALGDPCTPTIAPLHPSLAQMCLSSVEAEPEEDLLPLALKDLPMHRMRTTSDLFEQARNFSTHSNPHVIQSVCRDRIPGWQHLRADDINVDQIMAGLSNQLFKVNVRENYPDRARFCHPHVLFRIYGKDVNSLYDSQTEIQVFKHLGKRGVAPHLIAEFEGGRIEEWIEGSALLVTDMKKSGVLAGAAAILAGIHQIDLSKVLDTTPCIQRFLSRWRKVEPDHPSYLAIQRLNLPLFCEESYRLESLLFPETIPETPVTNLTFCHNDIQENNIMVTRTCMRLIDFEYSGYNYPAYDIACFFWEMTCDYCVESYPFFHIDPTRYPLIEKRRLFIAMYLSKLLRTSVKTSDHDKIDQVLDAIERFQLASHMLWGFWSVIRAPQAATATSFDMLYYGQKRIDAYWAQKAKLIAQGIIPDDKGRWRRPNGFDGSDSVDTDSIAPSTYSASIHRPLPLASYSFVTGQSKLNDK